LFLSFLRRQESRPVSFFLLLFIQKVTKVFRGHKLALLFSKLSSVFMMLRQCVH